MPIRISTKKKQRSLLDDIPISLYIWVTTKTNVHAITELLLIHHGVFVFAICKSVVYIWMMYIQKNIRMGHLKAREWEEICR
jgi:hypothetical protein